VVFVEHRRDRQPVAEGNGGERRWRLGGKRQPAAALALQGQDDSKGAAAEGAEESSAPQAVRC